MSSGLPDTSARDSTSLEEIFRYFGEYETPKLDSAVYTAYCLGIAEDEDLKALAALVMPSQPAPNVLFASVKDLLLEDPERSGEARRLAKFYPSISGAAIPEESAFPAFRAFCLAHAGDLSPGLCEGRTQTCVVHRSAIMLPAFARLPRVAQMNGRVALLEVGPSVGLNLRLDHYRYIYRSERGTVAWGPEDATPVLVCEVRGSEEPPLPGKLEIVARHGLELAPINLDDPKALRWLRALIWPEHQERARLMDEALEVAERVPAQIDAGDATCDIEAAITALPADAARVVFATHAVYQIPREGLLKMLAGVARASAETPVDLVIMESTGKGDSRIDWFEFAEGERKSRRVLAHSDSHGRWIEWGREE